MAVIGGLANMVHRERDKQTMGAIVAGAFLISFLINVRQEPIIVLQIARMVAFDMAVTRGIVTIFSGDENRRSEAMGTGIASLGTTLLIRFTYLDFNPFTRRKMGLILARPLPQPPHDVLSNLPLAIPFDGNDGKIFPRVIIPNVGLTI